MYLDILMNDDEDALLYVNGKAHSDIDGYWVDCLEFLKPILEEKDIIINKRFTEEKRRDFPEEIDSKGDDYKWCEINIYNLQDCLMRETLKCKLPDEEIIIDPGKEIPSKIRLDAFTRGKWYRLIR